MPGVKLAEDVYKVNYWFWECQRSTGNMNKKIKSAVAINFSIVRHAYVLYNNYISWLHSWSDSIYNKGIVEIIIQWIEVQTGLEVIPETLSKVLIHVVTLLSHHESKKL